MNCEVQEQTKSTHRVEVAKVVLEPIPGADKVALARVFGYPCVTAKEQWADCSLGAYIPPDSLVDPSRPEFAFLLPKARADGLVRIKAMKLRGVLSFGLLVPAPLGAKEGDDVAELLGVTHYEPPLRGPGSPGGGLVLGGDVESGPPWLQPPKYDIEAFRRYAHEVFTPGEPVVVTEKIHGANARYVFVEGRMYCGSRTTWKKEYPNYDHLTVEGIAGQIIKLAEVRKDKMGYEPVTEEQARARAEDILTKIKGQERRKNMWWEALDRTPTLREFCERNPGCLVYGEVYGAVQDLPYGHKPGEISFAAFDIMENGKWVNSQQLFSWLQEFNVPIVPIITPDGKQEYDAEAESHPYDFDKLCAMAEGKTLIPGADHVREGVVVKPVVERWNDKLGRVQLKIVGAGYLERSK